VGDDEAGAARWSLGDLYAELSRFEQDLKDAELQENTVRTYVDRTTFFLRWLGGDYEPRGPQSAHRRASR